LLVDDLSRYMWVAVIPCKDRATIAIKDIKARAEGESSLKLKSLHTDCGGEFTVMEFTDNCAAEGVHRQHTTPYNPQQNDVVKRRNGTVVATARSMLKAKCLPGWFSGEAVNTAVYVLNMCPMKSVDDMTPFEAWHGRKPAVHHLMTCRCIVYVRNTMAHLKKLEDRGHKMIFVGYESGSKAYRMHDPITKRVHVTHDVVFDEQAQWDWGSSSDNIRSFKEEMAAAFKMSDLGLLHYYLGIEVKQSVSNISLSQGAYTMKILEKSGMPGCNLCHVPIKTRLKLSKQST
jgi:hypothetical protein